MPHLVFNGEMDLRGVGKEFRAEVHRWGTAVLKIESVWWRTDEKAMLVEGVVVEHSRAVHPVAVAAVARGTTSVRLWSRAPVERTPAVQRWLAVVAEELQGLSGRLLRTTNIAEEILEGLDLTFNA